VKKCQGITLPRVVGFLVGFPLVLSLTQSCGGSSGITESLGSDADTPRATSVTVSPTNATLGAVGTTVQLSAVVLDQNGQVMSGASVSWSSSASSVASVNSSGLVTAVGNGTTTITARSGIASGSAEVSVGGNSYVSVLSWGGNGTMNGKFAEAGGVAIDTQGNIWVADRKNETIQQFDPSGNYLSKFTTTIVTAATYDGPSHIGFTDDGNLYAMSTSGGWVARYDGSGNEEYLGSPQYGAASKLDFAVDPRNGDFYVVFVGALGKFGGGAVLWQKTPNDLRTVTVDSKGTVYVSAFPGVQKYDADGSLVAEIDLGTTRGTLAVDSSDRLYFLSTEVSERYLKVFDGSLNLLTTFEINVNCWTYDCSFAVAGDGQYLYISLNSPVTRDLSNKVLKYDRR